MDYVSPDTDSKVQGAKPHIPKYLNGFTKVAASEICKLHGASLPLPKSARDDYEVAKLGDTWIDAGLNAQGQIVDSSGKRLQFKGQNSPYQNTPQTKVPPFAGLIVTATGKLFETAPKRARTG